MKTILFVNKPLMYPADLMIDHKKFKLSHDFSLGQSMMYASRHPTVESGRKVIEGTTQKVRTHIFTTCLPPPP